MSVKLDHLSSRDQVAAAKLLDELLGVPWAEQGIGPFSPVYLNDGLTLDFIRTDEEFPAEHYGHQWEMLTVSYARRPGNLPGSGRRRL